MKNKEECLFVKVYRALFKKYKYNSYMFSEIEKKTKAYLQVSIIKPDVLVDTGDTNFHNIDLYKLGKNVSMDKRVRFYNMVKMYFQNYANSYYVVINEKDSTQPLIFTVWNIGLEIRIGVFISKDSVEKHGILYEDAINEARKRLSIFDGSSLQNIDKEVDRNSFYLIEKSINLLGLKHKERETVEYISILFANFVSNVTRFYFENSSRD